MEQSRIDHFFEQKLESFEMTPREGSWEQIHERISGNSHNWWRIGKAAVVLIGVVLLTFLLTNNQYNQLQLAQVVPDGPLEQVVEPFKLVESTDYLLVKEVSKTRTSASIPESTELKKPDVVIELEPMELIALTQKSFEIELFEPTFDYQLSVRKSQPKISIVYSTQLVSDSTFTSKSKLSKIWDYARSSSPAEMMADFRDAKDQFIDTRLSLD